MSAVNCMHGVDVAKACAKCDGAVQSGVDPFLLERPAPTVDHPLHYGSAADPYEAIKVIDAWDLDFNLGNTVKYIRRAGKKPGVSTLEDLQKALWYLTHAVTAEMKR